MLVIIKDYSDDLAAKFLKEKERISHFLPSGVQIEHVGSSAVGIGGKNIIDILIGVSNREQMQTVRDILIQNGYFEGNDSCDDRIFLASKREETGEGDFHIHICPTNEDVYKDFLILRDFLRANPDQAQEYFTKKHQFAAAANFDRQKYKSLKAHYVSELLIRAKEDRTNY